MWAQESRESFHNDPCPARRPSEPGHISISAAGRPWATEGHSWRKPKCLLAWVLWQGLGPGDGEVFPASMPPGAFKEPPQIHVSVTGLCVPILSSLPLGEHPASFPSAPSTQTSSPSATTQPRCFQNHGMSVPLSGTSLQRWHGRALVPLESQPCDDLPPQAGQTESLLGIAKLDGAELAGVWSRAVQGPDRVDSCPGFLTPSTGLSIFLLLWDLSL